MSKYYPTIGLEVHAELATKTGMFCNCKNDPDETRPNVNVCPICMGHPGTLPVINEAAVKHVMRMGLAVNGEVANFTEFDRKNYFYPDIPKGYQISQYKHPIVKGGEVAGVQLTRIHLEEDTGLSKHDRGDFSLIDFNRSGVPLMELVTEPVIKSGEEVMSFAKELQLLLRYLGASHANMEKGEMRIEVNVSVSDDPKKFGTKVEIKNINSINAAGRAATYEIARMSKLLDEGKGHEIVQETRGWNDARQETYSQRKKESSHDYRYFPDPDLPKLYLHELYNLDKEKEALPELPHEKRARYKKEYGIKDEDIESFVTDIEFGMFFEEVTKKLSKQEVTLASNYLTTDVIGLGGKGNLTPESFAKLIQMNKSEIVNSRTTKDILITLVKEGGDPEKIANEQGLIQKSDPEELKKIAQKIITGNEKSVADYRAGKEVALKFLVGQMMKETKGSANPKLAEEILKETIGQ